MKAESSILKGASPTKKLGVADSLTQPVAAGTDTLQVKDPSQFPVGSYSVLSEGTSFEECIQVDAYGSLKLKTPLQNSHPVGSSLSPASDECQLLEDANIDYSKKSISTQVDDLKNKVDIPNIDTMKPDVKSVSEQLGIKQQEQIPQIETTMGELKTLQPPTTPDISKLSKLSNADTLKEEIKKNNPVPHELTEDSSGVKYVTDSSGVVYDSGNIVEDTYQNEDGDLVRDTWKSDDKGVHHKVKTDILSKKPYGGPPVEEGATEVQSFYTGETITKEELKGTVLENAPLNAVAVLHPNDIENLKNTEEVNKTLADAEKKFDEKFNTEIEKTENLVLEQQSGGIVFGVQLPEVLNGNQIVMNSERVLISAKTQEMGLFSKRKFFVTTDDEITMNCKQRFVVKSDRHASFEAPTVHLGLYTTRNHPSLKGDCVKWWLDDLCDWLSSHVHNDPYVTTSTPVQQGSLAALKARTPTLLSERIFISG
tara:strand:- start:96 stop:1541 length:1446 start_codon:yes stop_codon:yes gene_type:complete